MTKRHRILGIVGGMGSVAAAHFFQRLVALSPGKVDQDYIEVVLHNNSQVPDRTAALAGHGVDPRPELRRSCLMLEAAGVDVIALACMTSHAFLPDLMGSLAIPIIDAPAETARFCRKRWPGTRRVGVLATDGSLKSGIFHRAMAAESLEVLSFTGAEQQHFFTEPIYADWGIKTGNTNGLARDRLVAAGRELAARGAEVVIAGCTEVPVVLRPDDLPVPLLDATEVLITRAIRICLGGTSHVVLQSGDDGDPR